MTVPVQSIEVLLVEDDPGSSRHSTPLPLSPPLAHFANLP